MKRNISADEVRRFFDSANAQFEEAGFFLNDVRFRRDEDGKLSEITLNYTETNENITPDSKNPTEGSKTAISG